MESSLAPAVTDAHAMDSPAGEQRSEPDGVIAPLNQQSTPTKKRFGGTETSTENSERPDGQRHRQNEGGFCINQVNKEVLSGKNVILVFKQESQLDIFTYDRSQDVIDDYFKKEKSGSGEDIVYVSADSGEDVRSGFRNYFSDTRDFVVYLETGCESLRRQASPIGSPLQQVSK